MATRLLKFAEVSKRVGLGRSAIYERVADGRFPAPIKVGSSSRWSEEEIEAWLERAVSLRVMPYKFPEPLEPDGKKAGKRDRQKSEIPEQSGT